MRCLFECVAVFVLLPAAVAYLGLVAYSAARGWIEGKRLAKNGPPPGFPSLEDIRGKDPDA